MRRAALQLFATLVPALAAPTALAAAGKQAALIHLETGPRVKPAEVEPLEHALAEDIADFGWTIVWADPAVTKLAIDIDPARCLDVPCRQRLARALGAKLIAGGNMDRRKDPVLGSVVELSVWIMDPKRGQLTGEATEHCTKCSAAEVQVAWLRALRNATKRAGLVGERVVELKRPPPRSSAAPRGKTAAAPPRARAGARAREPEVTATTEVVGPVEAPAGPAVGPSPRDRGGGGLFGRRMLRWYAAGAGVALGAAGVTFVALDGPRYESCTQSATCMEGRHRLPDRYETLVPGLLMTAGALAFFGAAAYLTFLDRQAADRPEAPAASAGVLPTPMAGGAGVQMVLRW